MESGLFTQKLYLKVQAGLLFFYLAFFSFGQIPHLLSQIVGLKFFIAPTDAVIIISSFLGILFSLNNYLKKDFAFTSFIIILIFSFLLSVVVFGPKQVFFPGLFYLVRLIAYLYFFKTVSLLVKSKLISKDFLLKILLILGLLIAIFGLVQLIFIPDLTSLHIYGWDDHYYRLVSSFLDPAFTGILLLLALILSIYQKQKLIGLIIFVSLVLTYSRASYLALFLITFFVVFKGLKISKNIIYLVFISLALVLLIPRPGGEGVNLLRTKSIELKLSNFNQSLEIIKNNPLFGVGFNNLCLVKPASLYVYEDHGCSGLDNSFLFLAATVGFAGLLVYIDSFIKVLKKLWGTKYFKLFVFSLIAVLIHAQFTNTLFYPSVLGWLAILQS